MLQRTLSWLSDARATRLFGEAVRRVKAWLGAARAALRHRLAPAHQPHRCLPPDPWHHRDEPPHILREQLSRNTYFLGDELQERLSDSLVAVVGLGAVGSHAAAILGRCGVRHLRLVDPSRVQARNLAYHASATRDDLGMGRAEVSRVHLLRTVPRCQIEVCPASLDAGSADWLLGDASAGRAPDLVLLCTPAADMDEALCACIARRLRTIVCLSSAAAASYAEPAHQMLACLHDVCCSAEARALIRRLRALSGRDETFPAQSLLVLFSGLSGAAIGMGALAADEYTDDGATPVLAAIGAASLAALGDAMAAASIGLLTDRPLELLKRPLMAQKARYGAWKSLASRERDVFQSSCRCVVGCTCGALGLWPEDVEFIFNEVWGRRCAVSGVGYGDGGSALVLTRWDSARPVAVGNCVLLSKGVAEAHDEGRCEALASVGGGVSELISRTLEAAHVRWLRELDMFDSSVYWVASERHKL